MTFTVGDLRLALIGHPDTTPVRVVVRPTPTTAVSCSLTDVDHADGTPGLLFLIGDVQALGGGE